MFVMQGTFRARQNDDEQQQKDRQQPVVLTAPAVGNLVKAAIYDIGNNANKAKTKNVSPELMEKLNKQTGENQGGVENYNMVTRMENKKTGETYLELSHVGNSGSYIEPVYIKVGKDGKSVEYTSKLPGNSDDFAKVGDSGLMSIDRDKKKTAWDITTSVEDLLKESKEMAKTRAESQANYFVSSNPKGFAVDVVKEPTPVGGVDFNIAVAWNENAIGTKEFGTFKPM